MVFPEGRLSRDGNLGEAKLGLLGYLTRGFNPGSTRDIIFISVGINYGRVVEDRSLLRSLDHLPRQSAAHAIGVVISYGSKALWQSMRGKRYRNGYACVNFGKPVSLREWMNDHSPGSYQLNDVSVLANDLMKRIGDIVPILPVSLVTTIVITRPERGFSVLELKAEVLELLITLEHAGYRAYIPRGDDNYAVDVGVRMLIMRGALIDTDGVLQANPNEQHLLNYYANSIRHLVNSVSQSSTPNRRSNPV